ncbi:hypothetical protein SEA_NICEHOUSE_44 [Rhodococcus phage NiceHouse]|nr:hypothetical protein SEA_NICEHOUSE_44 [Rhodococcus phage NiceHouse]
MQREDFKTDIGRLVFDYSPIQKTYLPLSIFEKLRDEFLEENEINLIDCESCWVTQPNLVHPIAYYVDIDANSDLNLYTEWRNKFSQHGYSPPLLNFSL